MSIDETPEVAEATDLYSLPLAQFIAARDQLAQRLRSEGQVQEAERVGKLRKPSLAAWALNRTARHNPDAVKQLLESHQRLREADSRAAMEEASQMRRRAVTSLTDAAMVELAADGHAGSAQTRDRINRTLLAVATDPQGEAELSAGLLVRELEPSGGGWGEVGLPPPPPVDPGQEAVRAAEQARARAEKLETEAAAAEEQLETAKEALTAARRRLKQTRAAADKAAEEVRQAEQTARDLG